MPLNNLEIVDPYAFKNVDCPLFVQAADMTSFFGWGIRKRTSSLWNHSMVLYKEGILVSQSWTLRAVHLHEYMKKGQILKFWACKDITMEERNAINIKIMVMLKKPWYKRMYDGIGIFGQLFGLRKLNIPWLNYCSENVVKLVNVIFPDYSQEHPTPEDIDTLFKNKERMTVIGYSFKT